MNRVLTSFHLTAFLPFNRRISFVIIPALCIIAAALVVILLWRAAKRGHDIKGIISSMIIGASIIIGSLIIANALS